LAATVLAFKGTHGTSSDNADAINKSGRFDVSRLGLKGHGAYFWLGDDYGVLLAQEWFLQGRLEGRYGGNGTVIRADLKCFDDEFLNLELDDMRTRLSALYRKMNATPPLPSQGKFFALFISELEREGRKVYIVFGQVSAPHPPGGSRYPVRYLGAPWCYCVRRESCITITGTEEIP
jgi:hypothetical protein